MLRRPVMPGSGAERPRAEKNGVGKRAQEPHHESVGLVAAADRRAGRRFGAQRHDAVDRFDEVRVNLAGRKAKAAVDLLQLRRHLCARDVGLVENVERFDQCSDRDLAVSRNSVRSCGSFS